MKCEKQLQSEGVLPGETVFVGFCAGCLPLPHQIHLLPCPHPAQCPQRQNSVEHTNGLLGALMLATGSSGGCGEKEESEVRVFVPPAPSCGIGLAVFLYQSFSPASLPT